MAALASASSLLPAGSWWVPIAFMVFGGWGVIVNAIAGGARVLPGGGVAVALDAVLKLSRVIRRTVLITGVITAAAFAIGGGAGATVDRVRGVPHLTDDQGKRAGAVISEPRARKEEARQLREILLLEWAVAAVLLLVGAADVSPRTSGRGERHGFGRT